MIKTSFSVFDVPEIVPVKKVGEYYIAELFHGPTYAFKGIITITSVLNQDIALQFVGALLDYFLKKRKERMTVLVATSGDTGSTFITITSRFCCYLWNSRKKEHRVFCALS